MSHNMPTDSLGFGNRDRRRMEIDSTIAGCVCGLAASFGISHIDFVHNGLSRLFPRVYPIVNVLLPCGRAVFGLGLLARAAELQEQKHKSQTE